MSGLIFGLSLTLAFVTVGLLLYGRHKVYYHFKVVVPGEIYRSGTLGSVGLFLVRHKYKIKTIINLRTEKEAKLGDWYEKETLFCKQNNVSLVNIPMEFDTPPDAEQIQAFLDIVMEPACYPVLVHCEAGVIRTGMMVAVFLKQRFGTSNEEIIKELPLFGHHWDTKRRKARGVEDFLLNYGRDDA